MDIIDWFALDFRSINSHAVEYIPMNDYELVVRLDDGDSVMYDLEKRTIRNLPKDSTTMSEEQFRLEFGYRLRRRMERRGLTQGDLAELASTSQVMISNYIRGKTTPSAYVMDKIAKALSCSIDELTYR